MRSLVNAIALALFINSALADNLELNYETLTGAPVLAKLMQDIEPVLRKEYADNGMPTALLVKSLRQMATSLGQDKPYKSTLTRIRNLSPTALRSLRHLPKSRYPNLWKVGQLEYLRLEKEKSERLARALEKR